MDDELFQVKNYFYLGNYQKAVNEASQGFSEGCKTELDCLIYRSYVGMGNHGVRPPAPAAPAAQPFPLPPSRLTGPVRPQLVMAEVADDAPMDLQAVKLFASYMSPGLREPGARPKPSPRAARPARAGPLAAAVADAKVLPRSARAACGPDGG